MRGSRETVIVTVSNVYSSSGDDTPNARYRIQFPRRKHDLRLKTALSLTEGFIYQDSFTNSLRKKRKMTKVMLTIKERYVLSNKITGSSSVRGKES